MCSFFGIHHTLINRKKNSNTNHFEIFNNLDSILWALRRVFEVTGSVLFLNMGQHMWFCAISPQGACLKAEYVTWQSESFLQTPTSLPFNQQNCTKIQKKLKKIVYRRTMTYEHLSAITVTHSKQITYKQKVNNSFISTSNFTESFQRTKSNIYMNIILPKSKCCTDLFTQLNKFCVKHSK